jgi:hypothetical protein
MFPRLVIECGRRGCRRRRDTRLAGARQGSATLKERTIGRGWQLFEPIDELTGRLTTLVLMVY